MPAIPAVPGLDPISHPAANPGEFGSGGEAISKMGDSLFDDSQMEWKIRKAQEHVDSLAARNQLDAAYADIQDQLAKTPNSRDVPDVINQGNKTLNDISARWSNSPASPAIQMDADSLRPSLAHVGTVRQVDLMGKELKITLSQQAEKLAGDYASGNRTGAMAAFGEAVSGGVKTGLLGDAEAGEYMRRFAQAGQELQIKNGITNANPEVNQQIYDQIAQHRDQFPDVTQEQLDTFKGQALAAFEAHTKFQDWAEGDMALKTQLRPKIQQFTNPATGHFDEGGALTDNAERFARGEITETQSKVLAQGFSSHQSQLEVGLKEEANKRLDGIEKDLSGPRPNFAAAAAKLQESQPWFENNGFGNDYRAALRYMHSAEVEVRSVAAATRAAASAERAEARQEAFENSQDALGQVQHFIASGGMLTKPDIYNMAGAGKGKMLTHDVDAAWKMMQTYQNEPDFAAAMKQLNDSFVDKSTKAHPLSAEQAAAQNRKYAETMELFQQQVNAHPDQSKQVIMNDLLKTKAVTDIKEHADKMFGVAPAGGGLKAFLSSLFTPSPSSPLGKEAAKDAPAPARPKSVPENYQWNPSGNNGKGSWQAPKQ